MNRFLKIFGIITVIIYFVVFIYFLEVLYQDNPLLDNGVAVGSYGFGDFKEIIQKEYFKVFFLFRYLTAYGILLYSFVASSGYLKRFSYIFRTFYFLCFAIFLYRLEIPSDKIFEGGCIDLSILRGRCLNSYMDQLSLSQISSMNTSITLLLTTPIIYVWKEYFMKIKKSVIVAIILFSPPILMHAILYLDIFQDFLFTMYIPFILIIFFTSFIFPIVIVYFFCSLFLFYKEKEFR